MKRTPTILVPASVPGYDRVIRFLSATSEQAAQIDAILDRRSTVVSPTGPLLMRMTEAAQLLGVSRATLWRMIKAGKLARIEVLPGSFRVRRAEVEMLAAP